MAEEKNVHYTILALKMPEVEKVASTLQAEGRDVLADWLVANAKNIYGNSSSGWKPFQGKTVQQLLDEEPLKQQKVNYVYYNKVLDIDSHGYEFGQFLETGLNLIFIDPFIVFTNKYWNLVLQIDASTAKGETCLCCFIMPELVYEQFQEICFLKWSSVLRYYVQGINHRIVYRKNDLYNFKNNIRQMPLLDSIHPSNMQLLENGIMPKLK